MQASETITIFPPFGVFVAGMQCAFTLMSYNKAGDWRRNSGTGTSPKSATTTTTKNDCSLLVKMLYQIIVLLVKAEELFYWAFGHVKWEQSPN